MEKDWLLAAKLGVDHDNWMLAANPGVDCDIRTE